MKFKVVEGWVEKLYRTVDVILVDDNDDEIGRELIDEFYKEHTGGEDLSTFDIEKYQDFPYYKDKIENAINSLKIKHKLK